MVVLCVEVAKGWAVRRLSHRPGVATRPPGERFDAVWQACVRWIRLGMAAKARVALFQG